MKINKCTKLSCTAQDKEKHPYISLKKALNHGLILKKVHRVIEFRQEAWLKPYIDMNTKLRMHAKNEFEKDFLNLMNNSVFSKTMKNVKNHRENKIVTTNKQRSKFASELNYHTTKYNSEDLLIMEMSKTIVKMNKPLYLGQAILAISKALMYKFSYDFIKSKYSDKASLCYMDVDGLIINVKTEDFYENIADNIEERFDTSNYDKNDKRLLQIGINK